jgi:hypothetical protein
VAEEMRPTSEADRKESGSERADRNFREIVQELRVGQTGVQILFAFLLSLAFQNAFPHNRGSVAVLTAALLLAAAAASCFMAPVAHHRLHFRQGRKEALVWLAHWMALCGLVLVAAAMALSVWLVIAFLWSAQAATKTAIVMLLGTAALWLVVPVWIARMGPGGHRPDGEPAVPSDGERLRHEGQPQPHEPADAG